MRNIVYIVASTATLLYFATVAALVGRYMAIGDSLWAVPLF